MLNAGEVSLYTTNGNFQSQDSLLTTVPQLLIWPAHAKSAFQQKG